MFLRFCLIVLLSFTFKLQAQLPEMPITHSSADFAPYKGVKKCMEYEVLSPDDKPTDLNLSRFWEYDNNGLPITELQFMLNEDYDEPKLDTSAVIWLTYNNKKQLARKKIKDIYLSAFEEIITVYDYDKKGKLIKKETASIDPPTELFTYNKKGNLLESKITQKFPEFDDEGNHKGSVDVLTYQNYYKSDASGRITEVKTKKANSSDDEFGKVAYSYDAKGKLSKFMRLYSDGNLQMENIYSYDEKGRVSAMKINEYGTEGQRSTTYYIYVYK